MVSKKNGASQEVRQAPLARSAVKGVQVPHGQRLASSRHYVTQTTPTEVTKLVKPVAGRYRAATGVNVMSPEIGVVVEADSVSWLEGSMR